MNSPNPLKPEPSGSLDETGAPPVPSSAGVNPDARMVDAPGSSRKYEWDPKWTKDKNYNCTTCKWLGITGMVNGGEHWGCGFNESWQRWVPQRLAKRKAVCTVPEERPKFRDPNVHWDPVEGFKPKPVTPLGFSNRQQVLGMVSET